MKKPASPLGQLARRGLSLLLCCLLTVCLGLPVSSAAQPDSAGDTASTPADSPEPDTPEDSDSTDKPDTDASPAPSDSTPAPDDTDKPGDTDAPDGTATPSPEGSPGPGVSPAPDGSPEPGSSPEPDSSPEPVEKPVTVRFILHEGDELEIRLLQGGTVRPEDVPTGQGEELTLVGWTDVDGNPVEPAAVPIQEDTVFIAQWAKRIEGLFDLESHRAYVSGKGQGMFFPNAPLTRAEAAVMLYSLMKNRDWEPSGTVFSDVPADAWYAKAVEKAHSLDMISGYHDGTFRPNRNITRAEFITIAAACDELAEGECPFTDKGEVSWAERSIVSAYCKGWVAGGGDNKFNPGKLLKRAEAVTIINAMMGRRPDAGIKKREGVKNFYDVFLDHWAYGHIAEASTTHMYKQLDNGAEAWTDYVKDTSTPKKGWITSGGNRYYVGPGGKCLRGEQTIDGKKYIFDNTGAAFTGFRMTNGWKRYYKNGLMQEDISEMGVVEGPYLIKVYKPANYLIIFAKGDDGKYNIPVRSMITSCGNPTPTGTFYTPARYRWLEMVGGSWAQWCTQINGPYLFHSVPNDIRTNTTMWVNEYNLLGSTRSLGCIRLTCRDAKWMYDNCELGTQVEISPTETDGPMKKPTSIKLPAGHSWDPTDPTAYYLCQQRGCH